MADAPHTASQPSISPRTRTQSPPVQLQATLQLHSGTVSTNHLPSNCRNVTITALPGQNPLLDLSSRYGFIELCSLCTLRLVNVSITTDAQKASDSITNAFKGEPGSRVIQENGFSVRRACQPSNSTLDIIHDTARSKAFPALKGSQQQLASILPTPVTYKVLLSFGCSVE